jgi:hypothetical protein
MRHFLIRELGAPIAISSLSCRLQTTTAARNPIHRARASDRLPALLWSALEAEAPTAITTRASPELDPTASANEDPKSVRRHELQTADFWTWSSSRDEGALLHGTEIQKARELALPGLH